jgi:hypothetical protein
VATIELKGKLKGKLGGPAGDRQEWPYNQKEPTIMDAIERKGKAQ